MTDEQLARLRTRRDRLRAELRVLDEHVRAEEIRRALRPAPGLPDLVGAPRVTIFARATEGRGASA